MAFILSLFGGLGVYEHYEANKTRVALNEVRLQLAGTSETNSQSGGPPLIAPLALSGLAIMMIILLFVDGIQAKLPQNLSMQATAINGRRVSNSSNRIDKQNKSWHQQSAQSR